MSVARSTIKHMIELSGVASDIPATVATADGSGLPLERLEAEICELAGHLAAATCRFLMLVGDFDARQGWVSWELPSCAAWLAWKCQIAPGTAREHVRVARALRTLPVITGEFAAGRMSYAKVRALTRIATTQTDAELAAVAGPMTAGQLERFAAAHRRVSAAADQHAAATRRLSYRVEDDGSLAMTVRLPATDGAVVLQALRAACGDLEHPHRPRADQRAPAGTSNDTGTETAGQQTPSALADALVHIARDLLAGKIARASNPDIYQVIVHVGPEALTGEPGPQAEPGPDAEPGPARPTGHPAHPARCHLEDGPAISPAAAQRIACQATVSWMLHDHHGNVLDVGRRHRTPPPALRRAVRERDHYRCQAPGCQSRRTDIHHIRPWAKGGKTRLRDLILLCEAHHMIVHALGYTITIADDGTFIFTRPDGTVMPNCPPLPDARGDITSRHTAGITPDTIIPTGLADKFDLDQTIWATFANARHAEERRQAHEPQLAA
jgi:5-methylcytosine-specific restriction endonuclease McrA